MANIKSQIKRNRQNDKRRLRNRVIRGGSRVAVKNARAAIDEGVPESKAALASAISALDRAAEKGVLHRNNAARRKSRLVRAFNAMKPGGVKVEPKAVKPVVEPETPAKGKKATGSKAASKVAPKVETAKETKKAAAKKPAAKPSKAPAKKPAAKKPAAKKPASKSKK